uniref:Uncharacterized protein n=1 Tax=Panagrolaimus sp. PS1159 TaxID=55785 RepID=A0AC35F7C6_9BILA
MRFVFGIALFVKFAYAWYGARLCNGEDFMYLLFAVIGAIFGTILSYFIDRSRPVQVNIRHGVTTTIRQVDTVLGLVPTFCFGYLGILIYVELSKPPNSLRSEIYGSLYELILFLVSLYRGGRILWAIVDFLTTNSLPMLTNRYNRPSPV